MKNYIELTDKILEQLKKDNPNLNPERELNYRQVCQEEDNDGDNLPEMAHAIQAVGLIDFDIAERSGDGETWLQIEYFSKIEKTVIFDYDVSEVYDDLYSFAQQLAQYQEAIDKLESSIFIINSEILQRIDEMKENDEKTGEHKDATESDYFQWALEEYNANK